MTIGALVASLLAFGQSIEALEAREILSQFGIALITTLVGLTLRVYIGHFVVTLEGVQREALDSLRGQVAQFATDLRQARESLRGFRQETESELRESVRLTGEALRDGTEVMLNSLGKSAARPLADIEQQLTELSTALELSTEAAKRANSALRDVDSARHTLAESIRSETESIRRVGTIVKEQTEAIRSAIADLSGAVHDAVRQIREVGRSVDQVDVSSEIEKLREQLVRLGSALTTTTEKVDAVARSADRSSKIADGALLRYGAVAEELRDHRDRVADLLRELDGFVSRCGKDVEVMSNAMVASGRLVMERLGGDSGTAGPTRGNDVADHTDPPQQS